MKLPFSKVPTCKSFVVVREATKDKLTVAKLHAFVAIGNVFQPFLIHFQSDDPMSPFLYRALTEVMKRLYEKVVKPSIIEKAKGRINKIDVEKDENLLNLNCLQLDIATRQAIKDANASDQLTQFKDRYRRCVLNAIRKLNERSPLNHSLVQYIYFKFGSCFDW